MAVPLLMPADRKVIIQGQAQDTATSEDNYLLKGIEFVKNSASNIQRGFGDSTRGSSFYGGVAASLSNDGIPSGRSSLSKIMNVGKSFIGMSSASSEAQSWMTYTNYKAFMALFATSVLFFVLSFMTLPFIFFAPHKFGLLFTCASVTFLSSMAFLKGLAALMEHMMHEKRIVYSGALCTSMGFTFIFTTCHPVYILAFISSIVQTLTLISVIVSYVPGGAGALKVMYSSMWEFVKRQTRGEGSGSLPI
ncbi:hypothetical protein BgAZ_102840 [Babesia gibsoni]|uniref:Vesicle transport protein n=1 Tax=Babesia gibsoni TaxID=33632 RepID=A0AAD8PFK4_BABGI|nr:hypothetical protein BgAZ_102840 [Babesia gibsoni]